MPVNIENDIILLITRLVTDKEASISQESLIKCLDPILLTLNSEQKSDIFRYLIDTDFPKQGFLVRRYLPYSGPGSSSSTNQEKLDKIENEVVMNNKNELLKYLINHFEELDPSPIFLKSMYLAAISSVSLYVVNAVLAKQFEIISTRAIDGPLHIQSLKLLTTGVNDERFSSLIKKMAGESLGIMPEEQPHALLEVFFTGLRDYSCLYLAHYYLEEKDYTASAKYALFIQDPEFKEEHQILFPCIVKYFIPNYDGYHVLELRKAIAKHYAHAYDLNLDYNRVVITPGTSIALYVLLLMKFQKGNKIAIASPSYPCYRNVINALEYSIVEIETHSKDNYLITPESLSLCNEKIDGLLIASPNNPTGSMYDEQQLKQLVLYCKNNNIQIISDEIYHGITYEKRAETVLKFNDQTIVSNGFSKYFAMTGWRVGWMIIPTEDISRFENVLQNLILCTSPLTQIAAIKAFSAYQELDENVRRYRQNRDILYDALHNSGNIKVYKPLGGFYIYLELDSIKLDSMDLCRKILYETGVAVAPGLDFVSQPKTCSIRLSFCQSKEIVEQGAAKLNDFLKKL